MLNFMAKKMYFPHFIQNMHVGTYINHHVHLCTFDSLDPETYLLSKMDDFELTFKYITWVAPHSGKMTSWKPNFLIFFFEENG